MFQPSVVFLAFSLPFVVGKNPPAMWQASQVILYQSKFISQLQGFLDVILGQLWVVPMIAVEEYKIFVLIL